MSEQTLRVMSLHALVYCERLFYLEEVEEIRIADDRVYAGRTLHEALDEGEQRTFHLEDEALGLRGRVDAVRRRDGHWIPYEHKRGRARFEGGTARAWESDIVQIAAYALLLEKAVGEPIAEARIRYHANQVTVRVAVDASLRERVADAIARAQALRVATNRPQVHPNESVCRRCSLAPVCLPEESRAASKPGPAIRLFPPDDERQSIHVVGHGARVGKSGDELVVTTKDGGAIRYPIRQVRSVAIHGYSSVSAQALSACAQHDIAVHWFGASGKYVGTFHSDHLAVQRRIRQFEALSDPDRRIRLSQRLVAAKIQAQLAYALRATRRTGRPPEIRQRLERIRGALRCIPRASTIAELLGHEGNAAAGYFGILPSLVKSVPQMVPKGRSRRPPRDPFNAALSFGYALLFKEVVNCVRIVGLDPAFGFYHRPRGAAPPLALDLQELFRVSVVDIPILAAVNRAQLDPGHFQEANGQVWLTSNGRGIVIDVIERRMQESWRHPVLGYSLSYRRHIELEVRLLEKEWTDSVELFATTRMR